MPLFSAVSLISAHTAADFWRADAAVFCATKEISAVWHATVFLPPPTTVRLYSFFVVPYSCGCFSVAVSIISKELAFVPLLGCSTVCTPLDPTQVLQILLMVFGVHAVEAYFLNPQV